MYRAGLAPGWGSKSGWRGRGARCAAIVRDGKPYLFLAVTVVPFHGSGCCPECGYRECVVGCSCTRTVVHGRWTPNRINGARGRVEPDGGRLEGWAGREESTIVFDGKETNVIRFTGVWQTAMLRTRLSCMPPLSGHGAKLLGKPDPLTSRPVPSKWA